MTSSRSARLDRVEGKRGHRPPVARAAGPGPQTGSRRARPRRGRSPIPPSPTTTNRMHAAREVLRRVVRRQPDPAEALLASPDQMHHQEHGRQAERRSRVNCRRSSLLGSPAATKTPVTGASSSDMIAYTALASSESDKDDERLLRRGSSASGRRRDRRRGFASIRRPAASEPTDASPRLSASSTRKDRRTTRETRPTWSSSAPARSAGGHRASPRAAPERVVVLERDLAGQGASSRAAGVVRAQGGTPDTVAPRPWSIDFYRGQQERFGTDSRVPRARLPDPRTDAARGARRGTRASRCSATPGSTCGGSTRDEARALNPTLGRTATAAGATARPTGASTRRGTCARTRSRCSRRACELRERTPFLGLRTRAAAAAPRSPASRHPTARSRPSA